ncbi:hypothetical protein [Mariniblastus fucicola]|uniref:DUF4175 family protein n=1 Tax=Mariniblastus fucicola TaxID=980251 RepID=A0A5B9P5Q3_9BACT|nr:hypothetical protein [Mariniblastus fucicola]QEG20829.1 hypothetical protein MFFC18_06800 [Mariniblastus fucicola]
MNAKPNKSIPKTILDRLSALRSQLTQWIVVRGLSRWLLIVLGVLLLDILIDRVFKMDFSQRLIMLGVMIVVAALFLFWRLLKPLAAMPGNDALLHEIERGNGSLKESIISSVELSRVEDFESVGVSRELASLSIEKGIKDAQQIDFGKVIDRDAHRKNLGILGVGAVALVLLGVGVGTTNFLGTWFNRNILLGDQQWPQGTYLEIVGAKDGVVTLPRGVNHRQLVQITEDSTVTDISLNLEIENSGGGRTIYSMKPTGKLDGRQHAFVFNNISSTFRFRASGGDDVTEWVSVDLVEPPAIVELDMKVHLPGYTQADPVSLKGDGPHPVLAGSWLEVNATTNKPIETAVLKSGETVFPMKLAEDGLTFTASPGKDSKLVSGPYEFSLSDEGGLGNARKSKFTLSLKEDAVPRVRAELLGISGLISTRAMLPTEYQVADEYGLQDIQFAANWKTEQPQPDQAQSTTAMIATLEQQESSPWRSAENVAVFDILPMQLPPGTSLRLAVVAHDNRPDTPGEGKSQEFLLRVVTDDELRADLLRREDEQRKAFEQAYEIQLSLATELEALSISRPEGGQSEVDFHKQREMKLLGLVRDQKGIGTAIDRIATRFEEFLVEIGNNRLEEAEKEVVPGRPGIEERYNNRIIQPIRELDTELITLATQYLDNCRRVEQNPPELDKAVQQTGETQQLILERMKVILEAMNDSRSFQDFLNKLLELKSIEEGIKKANQEKMKPKDIFDDADPDDIFDDE